MEFLRRMRWIGFFSVFFWACGALPVRAEAPRSRVSPTQETEVFEPEATKLVLVDATPMEPGEIEWSTAYSILGSGKQWQTNGGRTGRKTLRDSSFQSTLTAGVVEGLDMGITEGWSSLTDKENSYDGQMDGPHKGHGFQDMTVNGRWRFYQSSDKTFRLAYVPYVVIPVGRRSNMDHLGPSQGYTSLGNTFALTKDIHRWTMSGNVGYETPLAHKERRANSAGTLTAGGGAGYHLLDWFQPQIEALYTHGFENPGKGFKLFSMIFGAIVPVNEHLRFDIGMVQDILGSGTDQTTSGVFKVAFLT